MARRKHNRQRSAHSDAPAPAQAGKRRTAKHRRGRGNDATAIQIFGLHAAAAALQNPDREISEILITQRALERVSPEQAGHGGLVRVVDARELDERLGRDTVHQGILVRCKPLESVAIEDVADRLADAPHGFVIVLDQVTDPHNVGAILRSAAVFGAQALVMTQHHSPSLTGVLAKAASGGLELVPIALVPNLARGLDTLKDAGVTCLGLDGEASQALAPEVIGTRCALVLGAEDKGLRRLTRERCDLLVKIAGTGSRGMDSLNVSNAAAVALANVGQAQSSKL